MKINRVGFQSVTNYFIQYCNKMYLKPVNLNKQTQKHTTMTIKETIELINILKAENVQSNNELIAFYERKVSEAYTNAINKAFA